MIPDDDHDRESNTTNKNYIYIFSSLSGKRWHSVKPECEQMNTVIYSNY